MPPETRCARYSESDNYRVELVESEMVTDPILHYELLEPRRTVIRKGVKIPACLNGPCLKEHMHRGPCKYPDDYESGS